MCGMNFGWVFPVEGGAELNRSRFCHICQNYHRFLRGVLNIWKSPPELMNGEVINRRKGKPKLKM